MFMDFYANQDDEFELQRFVSAQKFNYADAEKELANGKKHSHWMWYVFPQIDGLGRSYTAEHFAIKSIAEAKAYLAHDVLGQRLSDCVQLLLRGQERDARRIFGSPDDVKLCSCLTLFAQIDDSGVFQQALDQFFAGEADGLTLSLLQKLGEEKRLGIY